MPCKLSFYTNKEKLDKTKKLIISKNISDAITAVDARLPHHPVASTNTGRPQHVNTSILLSSMVIWSN